jgi:hypothetical protein
MDVAPSALLPTMMDASASLTDTGNAPPATAIRRETGAGPESPSAPMAALHARVASGEYLLGLIGARRFKK